MQLSELIYHCRSVRNCIGTVWQEECGQSCSFLGRLGLESTEPSKAEDELPEGVPLVSHPLSPALAECLQYYLFFWHRNQRRERINLLELEAVFRLEEKLAVTEFGASKEFSGSVRR